MNFGRCFESTAWNMILNTLLVKLVSPLRGLRYAPIKPTVSTVGYVVPSLTGLGRVRAVIHGFS